MEINFHRALNTISNNGLKWIDLPRPTREDMGYLEKAFSFHDLNLEDSLSKTGLPKIDRYKDHMFIILHFPTKDKEKNMPKVSQLSIFLGTDYLVTIHQGELEPLIELFQVCSKDAKQRESLMGKTSGYLLHTIIDVLVDDLFHILMKIVGNLDDIEEAVFDAKISEAREISVLRREITILRRIVMPLRRVVSELAKDVQQFSNEDLTRYFYDVKDHIDKVLETLDGSRETIEIYKDTDFMLSSEKSNKILSVLTILFTLSIPVTVISTFYGMNVHIPGDNQTGAWNFLGPYSTFFVLFAATIISTVVMLLYFRHVGWIGVSLNPRRFLKGR